MHATRTPHQKGSIPKSRSVLISIKILFRSCELKVSVRCFNEIIVDYYENEASDSCPLTMAVRALLYIGIVYPLCIDHNPNIEIGKSDSQVNGCLGSWQRGSAWIFGTSMRHPMQCTFSYFGHKSHRKLKYNSMVSSRFVRVWEIIGDNFVLDTTSGVTKSFIDLWLNEWAHRFTGSGINKDQKPIEVLEKFVPYPYIKLSYIDPIFWGLILYLRQ